MWKEGDDSSDSGGNGYGEEIYIDYMFFPTKEAEAYMAGRKGCCRNVASEPEQSVEEPAVKKLPILLRLKMLLKMQHLLLYSGSHLIDICRSCICIRRSLW